MSRAVVHALLAVSLAACGLRTMPRPPEDTAPVMAGPVVSESDADGTVLRWQRPERSADGRKLADLAAFVVEKKGEGDADWREVATVDVVDQEKIRRRRDFSWRDPEAGPAAYRVTAVCADGQKGEAATAVERVASPVEEADDGDATSGQAKAPTAGPAPVGAP